MFQKDKTDHLYVYKGRETLETLNKSDSKRSTRKEPNPFTVG